MRQSGDVLFDVISGNGGDVGHIILNRPQALNALTHQMIVELETTLRQWQTDENIKAVIISSCCNKAFCAGGDIRHVYELGNTHAPNVATFFRDEYRLNRLIHYYPKPYIALLDGITMGGGVGISMHGSHRIATERLTFAMPETGIGFFPDIGASFLLSRCPGKIGLYLGLTGTRLNTADTQYVGLIDDYVPSDRLQELINAIVNTGFTADGTVSDILAQFAQKTEPAPLEEITDLINECFSGSSMIEILENLRACHHPWAQKTLATLSSRSPTSLLVTFKELQKGEAFNLDTCLQMEYRLANRFLTSYDFYEGVRAVIIDKDRSPEWQPNDIKQISDEAINQYFAPLEDGDLDLE